MRFDRRPAIMALTFVGLFCALGPTPAHGQVHSWLLSDAGQDPDCRATIMLGSLDAQTNEPFYQWASQQLKCKHRLTITWTSIPQSATSTWRIRPASGDKETPTHAGVPVQLEHGHQIIDTSFDFWNAFQYPYGQPYDGPATGCIYHYNLFKQQGHDGKALLANGFEYHHPAIVIAHLAYVANNSSITSQAGSNTAPTTVRIWCEGNKAVAEKKYPTPVPPPPQRFRVSNPSLIMYLGNSPTPFSGRVETTCPTQIRLVGNFEHSSNVPGTVQSRFRWTPGPTSTAMTTQVVHAPGSLNYTPPQVQLVVPIPLPGNITPQEQPQGGGFVVVAQPQQQGPQLVQGALPANEHKASVRFELTSPGTSSSSPLEYHIVCTNQGAGQHLVAPQQQPPPGQPPVITTPQPQPPPGQPPPIAAQPPAAQPPAGAAAIVAAGGAGAFDAFTYVLEVPGTGAVGGFARLVRPRAAAARAATQQITLTGGSLNAAALQQALRAGGSATLIERRGGREVCRITLDGAGVSALRNETVANQAHLVLTARRIRDGCR